MSSSLTTSHTPPTLPSHELILQVAAGSRPARPHILKIPGSRLGRISDPNLFRSFLPLPSQERKLHRGSSFFPNFKTLKIINEEEQPPPTIVRRARRLISFAPLFLPYFSTREAGNLRLVNHKMRAAVTAYPWADQHTRVCSGSIFHVAVDDSCGRWAWVPKIKIWRGCFPFAIAVNLSCRRDLKDVDFDHLEGVATVSISMLDSRGLSAPLPPPKEVYLDAYVRPHAFTDAGVARLSAVRKLDASFCELLTDKAFVNLRQLVELNASFMKSMDFTDKAIIGKLTLLRLSVAGCAQLTDACLNLPNLEELNASYCTSLTDAAFRHLPKLRALRSTCNPSLSNAAYATAPLSRLELLDVSHNPRLTARAFVSLDHSRGIVIKAVGCSSSVRAAAKRGGALGSDCTTHCTIA